MTIANLNSRLSRLESQEPDAEHGRPFLWPDGQPLSDALAVADLTLADKPLFPIKLVGLSPGALDAPPCAFYLRDRHLLDS